MTKPHQRMAFLDRFAMMLSGICMIHCLVTPLLVALLPILGIALLSDREFHWLLLVLVLPASIWALASGCRRHRRFTIAVIGVTGLVILVSIGIAGHQIFGEDGERFVTSIGSATVAIAHLMNYRQLRIRT